MTRSFVITLDPDGAGDEEIARVISLVLLDEGFEVKSVNPYGGTSPTVTPDNTHSSILPTI
tara:strand:+ start:4994 stop:5176 length:183 start_codon:yes stop_codon:yes gene_type:complete